jgi:hypothetical protein
MRTLAAILTTFVLLLAPLRAEALTLRDIVELYKSGLSDDVLVALIEVNKAIYTLDAATLKQLKADGLSDRLLIAIINSGRANQPPPPVAVFDEEPDPEPAPPVVVIDHHDPPAPSVVVQQVPVYVPVPASRVSPRRVHSAPPSPGSPYYVGQVPERAPRQEAKPVYWGSGGKLRPDAWGQPAPEKRDRDEGRGGKEPSGKEPAGKEPGSKAPGSRK